MTVEIYIVYSLTSVNMYGVRAGLKKEIQIRQEPHTKWYTFTEVGCQGK